MLNLPMPLFLILFALFLPPSLTFPDGPSTEDCPKLSIERINFYNLRGLAIKDFLTKSLELDEKNGEFVSLGLDPERDRLKDQSSGSPHNPGGLIAGPSDSERNLYHTEGGFLIISATPEKLKKACQIVKIADAFPIQIQIETFIVKVDREKIENHRIDIAAVINAIQEFKGPASDKTLSPQTFEFIIGNRLDDVGVIRAEVNFKEKYIEVYKRPTQRVIHGKTTTLILGERIIFSVTSGLSSFIQPIDVALNVQITPQFVEKEARDLPEDAIRLDFSIEDATAKLNPAGTIDKIDRLNIIQPMYVRNGAIHPLGTLVSRSEEETDTGIPILRSVPLLNKLIGSERTQLSQNEAFIFVRAFRYNIFDDSEKELFQRPYDRIDSVRDDHHWYKIPYLVPPPPPRRLWPNQKIELEMTKKDGNFLGRLLKRERLWTSPYQVKSLWCRSWNPFTSLEGMRNFFMPVFTLTCLDNENEYFSFSKADGIFDTQVTDLSTSDWIGQITFHSIDDLNRVNDKPFFEISEIKMADMLQTIKE